MPRMSRLALLLALALPALLVINCGQPASPATPLLKQADRHLERTIEDIRGLEHFNEETQALLSGGRPPGTAEKLKRVLTDARSRAQAALDEVSKASSELRSAASLRVSSAMKEYLRLKSAAVDEQRRSLDATIQAMDIRLQTADAIVGGGPLDQALLDKLTEISRLEEEARKAAQSASEMHERANDYYEKKKLGK